MKYYVVTDVHGFYTYLIEALTEKGYFDDNGSKKLIICGDLMDRGKEAIKLQKFILDLMKKDEVILVKGNHEDLIYDLVREVSRLQTLYGIGQHHYSNGTVDTCLQLTNMTEQEAFCNIDKFIKKIVSSSFYQEIIPSMVDYFETSKYIFVHGFIPCNEEGTWIINYSYNKEWRNASNKEWKEARWINGMLANYEGVIEEGKTIVCGHFHTSYGHSRIEKTCSEFGEDADFSPYYREGIIALDGCTAYTHKVNCIILED